MALLIALAPAADAVAAGSPHPPPGSNALPTPDPVSPIIFNPRSMTKPPQGFAVSAAQAIRAADRTRIAKRVRAHYSGITVRPFITPIGLPDYPYWHWDLFYNSHGKHVAEVEVGAAGGVLRVASGPDVGWGIVRGDPGVLGGKLNAPYVWLPLCLLFVVPFFDPRRRRRLLHLDLAVLLLFGASHYFFNLGKPAVSVPLVYPFLVYVLVRMVLAALRPRQRSGELVPYASTPFLMTGVALLVVMRIAFGIAGSHTLDISAAGVVGADRVWHGLPLYVDNDYHGDTYGPVNYLAYVPFERIAPSDAHGVDPAAKMATLTFDLLIVLGLYLLGRQTRAGPRGHRLGVILAYAWVAYPYTALVIASNTNDALVPLFVIYALLAARWAGARGALAALAGLAKFAPLLLAPTLLAGRRAFRGRGAIFAAAAFALVSVALIAPFWPAGGLRELWNTTLGFQAHRTSPVTLWGRHPDLTWLQTVADVVAVAIAIAAAFVPRRRTTGQLAALCGATLAAAQIAGNYWMYFYLAWLAPFVFIALFEEYPVLGPVQASVTRSLRKPVSTSQPESVTTTRSSILTPSDSGT
ncbi:MAG: hypothetical protein ACJ76Z_08305 [Thermoleophilaceae bacterium]